MSFTFLHIYSLQLILHVFFLLLGLKQTCPDWRHCTPWSYKWPEADKQEAINEDQPLATLGRTFFPSQCGPCCVHFRRLHNGPSQENVDHLHVEHQPQHDHGKQVQMVWCLAIHPHRFLILEKIMTSSFIYSLLKNGVHTLKIQRTKIGPKLKERPGCHPNCLVLADLSRWVAECI